jgi:ACS family hexuronate transporter-like MFS transporter
VIARPEIQPETASAGAAGTIGRYRWRICALLFCATTINYVDRQVLGVLAPQLQSIIGWNEIEYGYIVTAFQAAYALGLLGVGRFIDRFGTRVGYAVAIGVWSLAAMGHALVHTALGFGVARFLLGLGESGNFPAAVKTVSEWFPRKERTLATGIFNSGSNVGAIVAPLMVPWIAVTLGWRFAFLFTGIFSSAWLVVWLTTYPRPREIETDPEAPAVKVRAGQLLALRQTWVFIAGKFITDPVWWFLLFWLPKFLNSRHGLSLIALGPPLVAIYLMADAGSIAGGWLASTFLKHGWSLNRARKTAMLICAIVVTPIVFAANVRSVWAAVALLGLAAASHQGWSANLFMLVPDLFPRHAVASAVGMGGFAGAIGGMVISTFTGFLLQLTGSYVPVFVLAGSTYLIALGLIQILSPTLKPAALA